MAKTFSFKKTSVFLFIFIAAGFTLTAGYLAFLQLNDNFHEIVPGELYRSAQMDADEIATVHQKYGIKTIINLRGENKGNEWYDREVAQAKNLGIQHINFRLASKRELNHDQAFELIDIMKNAPKPLLIHCRGGADRTGLAVSLYVADVKKWDEFPAELQMSLLYGHIAVWFNPAYAMNRTFEALEPALGYFDS